MDHSFLQYGAVALVALAAILGHSCGRELRPSDHGLAYQENSSPPTQNDDAQEMRSFFGATTTVQLPEAKNISDTWVSAHAEGRARDVGRDHVRLGLLVASAVCGVTGVVLLAISAIVFLYRLQKQRPKAERVPSTSALTSLPHSHAANKSNV